MKNLLILFFSLALLPACGPAVAPPPPASTDGLFRTTDPSRLYFRNIRSVAYEQNTQPGTRIDRYRLRRFDLRPDRPLLYPVIVDNWMADEAYIAIQTNDFPGGYPDTLRVLWQSDRDSGRHELSRPDWPGQEAFAGRLYASLRQGHRLSIMIRSGERLPLFDREDDRGAFLTTLSDYYRLTERE